jgi:hypothetical protein
MKTLTTTIAITFIAFTARASEQVPYIAMPVGIGYAVDSKGVRHPNALRVRDAEFAPHPQYLPTGRHWRAIRLFGRGTLRGTDCTDSMSTGTQVESAKS